MRRDYYYLLHRLSLVVLAASPSPLWVEHAYTPSRIGTECHFQTYKPTWGDGPLLAASSSFLHAHAPSIAIK